MKKRVYKEQSEQILLVKWFSIRYPQFNKLFFHIPNGQHVGIAQGRVLKSSGVVAGIPDMFLSVPSRDFHGLYIEMKAKGGSVQDHQKEIHELLRAQKYRVEVCYSFEEAKSSVDAYLHMQ